MYAYTLYNICMVFIYIVCILSGYVISFLRAEYAKYKGVYIFDLRLMQVDAMKFPPSNIRVLNRKS